MSEYAERDIMGLDEQGGYYCRHVSAMTREQLHSKSDIAGELAFRDAELDKLHARLTDTERQLREAQERCKRLESVLQGGLESLEFWSGYVDTYYQEKHDLDGDIAKLRAALSEPYEMTRPDNTEPWYGHKFKRFTGGKWRCECGLELCEPDEMTQVMREGKV